LSCVELHPAEEVGQFIGHETNFLDEWVAHVDFSKAGSFDALWIIGLLPVLWTAT
jgi:hypothetical protein